MWRDKHPEKGTAPSSNRETSSLGGRPLSSSPAAAESPGGRPSRGAARLGRTLSLKGELVGNEELILDGEFEGTIELGESRLTVGREGRVQADLRARDILVEGTVRGNLRASDRLTIAKTGNVVGDLVAARIVIEDGAYFKGSIDIQKTEDAKPAAAQAAGESFRIRPAPVSASPKDKLQ